MTERLPFTLHFPALEKEMATCSGILAWGNPMGQRSLVGRSPLGCKESDMIEHTHTYEALRSGGWFSSIVWGSLS